MPEFSEPTAATPRRRGQAKHIEREPGIQGFVASMPTCGNDLMGLWSLPPEALTQARLKICRQIPMSQKVSLIRDCMVQEYSMESVANAYGAGEYRIILNPGPAGTWGGKTAIINIAPEYARECGFNPMPIDSAPAPRISQLRSIQEATQSMDRGQAMTPAAMAQLMETMIERVAERMRPAVPAVDPLQNMIQMMTFVQGLQKSSLDQALALAGLNRPQAEESESEGWLGVARELAPVASSFLSGLIQPRQAAPVPATEPREVNPQANQGGALNINATEDELKPFAGAIAMLRPFAGIISRKVAGTPTGQEAARELADFIPPGLIDAMIGFSKLVTAKGPSVLAVIDSDLVNAKGAACVAEIGKILESEGE